MANEQDRVKEELKQRQLLAKLQTVVTDSIISALRLPITVVVENPDTNLLKEIAENSRKSASRALKNIFPTAEIRSSAVEVGQERTKVPTMTMRSRYKVEIYNNSGNIVYLGDKKVTDKTGLPLKPGKSATFKVGSQVEIYAVAESVADVRVIEYGIEKE